MARSPNRAVVVPSCAGDMGAIGIGQTVGVAQQGGSKSLRKRTYPDLVDERTSQRYRPNDTMHGSSDSGTSQRGRCAGDDSPSRGSGSSDADECDGGSSNLSSSESDFPVTKPFHRTVKDRLELARKLLEAEGLSKGHGVTAAAFISQNPQASQKALEHVARLQVRVLELEEELADVEKATRMLEDAGRPPIIDLAIKAVLADKVKGDHPVFDEHADAYKNM